MKRLLLIISILILPVNSALPSSLIISGKLFSWAPWNSENDESLLVQAEDDLKNANYEAALKKAEKCIQKSQNNRKEDTDLCHAWLIKALAHYYKEDNIEALAAFDATLKISTSLKDQTFTLRALDKKSMTLFWMDRFPESLEVTNSGFTLATGEKNNLYISVFLENRGRIYKATNEYQAAIESFTAALDIKLKNNIPENLDNTHNQLGLLYYNLGQYENAIENYRASLKISEENNDEQGKGICLNNIGNVYRKWGNYEKAIESLQNAMKIFDALKQPLDVANCLNNIGVCYENLMEENLPAENIKNLNNALQYHQQALEKRIEIADSTGIGNSYMNLGNVYSAIAMYRFIIEYGIDNNLSLHLVLPKDTILARNKRAIDYYNQAMLLKKKQHDLSAISGLLNNMGKIYLQSGLFEKAMNSYSEALKYAETAGDKYQEATNFREIGLLYNEKSEYDKAIGYLNKSNSICLDNSFPFLLRYNYKDLSQIYEIKKQADSAFLYYKKFIEIKDQLVNEEKYKQMAFVVTKYETDKKESEIKLLKADQQAQSDKMKYMRRTIYTISFAVVLFLFLSVMLFRLFQEKRKANIELEQKNDLITRQNDALEQKNLLITHQKKEITDSIMYASKIQTAVIPNKSVLDKLLKDYFVLFQPRDIVSGDFYYATLYEDQIIVAAADCTGHGVPGAFMSMLGISSLKEIVKVEQNLSSALLLDKLREYIINSFQQDQELEHDKRKDGMDIALLTIDPKNSHIQFAGAFNGAIIVRGAELFELNADHMPVGAYENQKPFTNHEFDYQPGDIAYIFSDGYADQFGGPKDKKFLYRNFKELLLKISSEPMEHQKEILWKHHLDWRKEIEQIDDILVIGIRLFSC